MALVQDELTAELAATPGPIIDRAIATLEPGQISPEEYVVDNELLDQLEASLVGELTSQVPPEFDTVAVVVPWDSPYARFGRMTETLAYTGYDNHAAMLGYEDRTIWLYTLDMTNGVVEHVKRLVQPVDEVERQETGRTGIEVVDDRLFATDPAEKADLKSITDFHDIDDIESSWNVTSNHSTGRGQKTDSLESAMFTLVSYKATYLLAVNNGVERLFAYLNPKAIKSLGRMGVEHRKLLDGEFHLPVPGKPGEYDHGYNAVVIPHSDTNRDVFTKVYTYEPVEGEKPDVRQQMRAAVSAFIANKEVPIFQVSEDAPEAKSVIARML